MTTRRTATAADAAVYTPESYLAQVTELIRTGRDQDAIDVVKRHGAAMLPRLTPEQVVRLSSMMEGAAAAIEAAYVVSRRRAGRAAHAS